MNESTANSLRSPIHGSTVAEDAVARLGTLERTFVEETLGEIAPDWQVSPAWSNARSPT